MGDGKENFTPQSPDEIAEKHRLETRGAFALIKIFLGALIGLLLTLDESWQRMLLTSGFMALFGFVSMAVGWRCGVQETLERTQLVVVRLVKACKESVDLMVSMNRMSTQTRVYVTQVVARSAGMRVASELLKGNPERLEASMGLVEKVIEEEVKKFGG